jgi:acyl-CoA thioester hydrolase
MSRPFEHRFRVNEKPENYIRHVNNLRYLEWFIDTAVEHANSLGWGMSVCKELDLAWVAKSHTIEYISPAYQDDDLLIKTWIEKVTATRITRCYECKRVNDEQLIAKASTVWVLVDYESGKPKAFPKDLKMKFDSVVN